MSRDALKGATQTGGNSRFTHRKRGGGRTSLSHAEKKGGGAITKMFNVVLILYNFVFIVWPKYQ